MNYIQETLNCNIFTDQLFYEEMLEQLDIEQDFMFSCLENNIILEADEAPKTEKKGGWIRRIIDFFKNLFNKFFGKTKEIVERDKGWLKDNVPKLSTLDYNGLSVNIIPYWNMNAAEIKSVLDGFKSLIDNMKIDDSRLKDLQTREQVEKFGKFKQFASTEDSDFKNNLKSYFSTGKIDKDIKPVKLENDELKKKCIGEMVKYVSKDYNGELMRDLKQSKDNFERMLTEVEKNITEDKSVKEAFCLIENAFYNATELALCANGHILFEAEEQKTEQKKDDGPALNKVEDTRKPAENKEDSDNNQTNHPSDNNKLEANNDYYNFMKHAIQLTQLAFAVAITVCEEKYNAYMAVLKGVVGARGNKK